MKSYSVERMREERKPVMQTVMAGAVVSLLAAAVSGALWRVWDDRENKSALLVTGVFLSLFLLWMGLYFLISDEKRMRHTTLYGHTLMRLWFHEGLSGNEAYQGGVKPIIAEIDAEAQNMLYECSGFALMRHWLVLYVHQPSRLSVKGTLASLPVRKRDVLRILWNLADGRENSPLEARIWVAGSETPWLVRVCEQADRLALDQWIALPEE